MLITDGGVSGDTKSPGKKLEQRQLLQKIVKQLERDDFVTDTLSLGDTKFMVGCLCPYHSQLF